MLVTDLVRAMEAVAPLNFAESWDKVGLLVGRSAAEVRGPILLTIDLTERVMDEAQAAHAGAIIAYHPPIWEPLARITDAKPAQRTVLRAAELGIAVYSPHTALDAAPGGITDWLCEGLSNPPAGDDLRARSHPDPHAPSEAKILGDCRALLPHQRSDPRQQVKIVTFVPTGAVENVRNALASAGAGLIGHYSVCSFAVPGSGTFLGDEHSHPTTGRAGQLETAPELRLEMVCSRVALPLALETLRRFHPYEEPAIDVYELLSQPVRSVGAGRRLKLDHTIPLRELAERLKHHLRRDTVRVAAVGADLDRPVMAVGICAGAGSSLARQAASDRCDVFVTGEMKHHEIMEALHSGMSVILGEHTSTERGYLPRLAARLRKLLPRAEVIVSTADADPLHTL